MMFSQDSVLNFLFLLSHALFLGKIFYSQDFAIRHYANVFKVSTCSSVVSL